MMVKETSARFVAGLGTTSVSTAMFPTETGTTRIIVSAILDFDYPDTNPWSLLHYYPLYFNPRNGGFFENGQNPWSSFIRWKLS